MSKRETQEYRGNGNHEWEEVTDTWGTFVSRLRVPGGWLYNTYIPSDDNDNAFVTTVFVPMPEVVKHKV